MSELTKPQEVVASDMLEDFFSSVTEHARWPYRRATRKVFTGHEEFVEGVLTYPLEPTGLDLLVEKTDAEKIADKAAIIGHRALNSLPYKLFLQNNLRKQACLEVDDEYISPEMYVGTWAQGYGERMVEAARLGLTHEITEQVEVAQ